MTRRRQANVEGGRPGRHEVKTTPEQEAIITLAASEQGVSWPRYVVEAAVSVALAGDDVGVETPTARRQRMAELFAARHEIAQLAVQAKRVGVNVNQVAHQVNAGGGLPVEEMRGYLTEERVLLGRAREVVERIDGVIDELAERGVDV